MTLIGVLRIIAGLSALPMLVAAIRRKRKENSPWTGFLILLCGLATAAEWLFLSQCTISCSIPYMTDGAWGNVDTNLVINGFMCGAIVVFVNFVLLSMVLFLKRGRVKRFALIVGGLFLVTLMATAIAGSLITGMGLDECFFGACCGVMYLVGTLLGFTYKEICMIGNVYLEAGICLLSGLWVTFTCLRSYMANKSYMGMALAIFGVCYGVLYIGAFVWLCHHYAMPLDAAFNLCFRELNWLAREYHTTYNNVNYVIFIVLFLVCTLGNLALVKFIERKKPN